MGPPRRRSQTTTKAMARPTDRQMGATIGMPRRDVHHTFEAIFLGKVTLMTDALDHLEESLKGRHQINHTEDEVLLCCPP